MQPQGLGGTVGCLFLPSLESAPKLAAACTEQTPDLLSWTFLGKASHLPPPPATADLLEPGLSLQDVLLHLVSICLHAGDEHGQLVCGGPERGTAEQRGENSKAQPRTAPGLVLSPCAHWGSQERA